jgi:hypothetical protein
MDGVTLGELILSTKEKTGHSYRHMAEVAKEAGYPIAFARIQQLASKPLTAVPERSTLLALGVALGLPVEDVAMAAVESLLLEMGVDLSMDVLNNSRARAFVTLTEGMSDTTVSHVLRVTRTLAESLESAAQGQGAEDGAASPGEPSVNGGGGDAPA